ncbi:hypothetical protein K2Z84_26580 [Candidatus Binatia bacterium]|jgi:hypothetical protein|nr:hypothetical protein [Candidatus Binatia bacterium]
MSTSNDAAATVARVATERELRLIAPGRKSGLPRAVTIWFAVLDDGCVGLGTLNEDRDWVRNARHAGRVELQLAGVRLRGRFADATDPVRHRAIRKAMARKYLPFRIAAWLGLGQRFTFVVDALEIV